jgi:hypothetical protein
MANAATLDTEERVLRFTIAFINTTTSRTGARCISRVNEDNGNTGKLSFVLDFLAQIMKRPTMQLIALGASSPNSVTNACQVFQGNRSLSALRFIYQLFADYMIYVIGKARLFAGKILEPALGRLCAPLLQFGTKSFVPVSDTLDMATGMKLPVAIGGDVDNAEVNTQNGVYVYRIGIVNVARGKQIKLTASER